MPDPLSDKDIMVLAILSLWRSSPTFFNQGIVEGELGSWIAVTTKIWDSPLDICVKISAASIMSDVTTLSFSKPPKEHVEHVTVDHLRHAMYVRSRPFLLCNVVVCDGLLMVLDIGLGSLLALQLTFSTNGTILKRNVCGFRSCTRLLTRIARRSTYVPSYNYIVLTEGRPFFFYRWNTSRSFNGIRTAYQL